MTPQELSEAADEFMLVSEILGFRAAGNTDSLQGNSDDDLLAALEALEPTIKRLREDLR